MVRRLNDKVDSKTSWNKTRNNRNGTAHNSRRGVHNNLRRNINLVDRCIVLHVLKRDVGIFIVSTVKIVVQFDVARD
jgi:hypothetical protein